MMEADNGVGKGDKNMEDEADGHLEIVVKKPRTGPTYIPLPRASDICARVGSAVVASKRHYIPVTVNVLPLHDRPGCSRVVCPKVLTKVQPDYKCTLNFELPYKNREKTDKVYER